jgi:glutaredoxin
MEQTTVTVYTRENCHLCEEAISTIRSVGDALDRSIEIELVDVDEDPELRDRYGERVPYVLVDGTPKFKYRVDRQEFRDAVRST